MDSAIIKLADNTVLDDLFKTSIKPHVRTKKPQSNNTTEFGDEARAKDRERKD